MKEDLCLYSIFYNKILGAIKESTLFLIPFRFPYLLIYYIIKINKKNI